MNKKLRLLLDEHTELESKIMDIIKTLPRYGNDCALNDDSDATDKEFDQCEIEQTAFTILQERRGFDYPVFINYCIVCGGEQILREPQ